jgi:TatD DNase family protein
MMITDSHCHLGSERFSEEEISEILNRATEAGVCRMVTLSTCLDDVAKNLEIATDPRVKAGIGIHPCDVHHAPDDAVDQLAVFTSDPRVCVIGETGLDYYHPAPEGWCEIKFRERQRIFLEQQFELAASSGLNIVIHTRDKEGHASFEDALAIYARYSERVRAVFHCFISDWSCAERVIALGGLVSFAGMATFRKADLVKETLKQCTAGSFMLETDSPYLAPEPVRGRRNEPAFTKHIAEVAATLRGESLEMLSEHTENTANHFFRW